MRRTGALAMALALGLGVGGVGCGGDSGNGDSGNGGGGPERSPTTAPPTTGSAPSAAELCGARLASDAPAVASDDLTELSGLAASRTQPGVLWAHNDSGGEPEVFALGTDGADRGRFPLDGAEAVDWEDMALATGEGGDVLVFGDIGDNDAERDEVALYRVPEPDLATVAPGTSLTGVEAVPLTYADGPRNAEALLADPVTGDLFVVQKRLAGGPVPVYRVPAGTAGGEAVVMEEAGEAALGIGEIVTGGDVSADGSVVALRTYGGLFLWDRAPDQTVPEALAGEPCRAPTTLERQGEAVAVDPDGRGYVTVGEGEHPAVNTARLG